MHEITNNDIANFLDTEPLSEEYEITNIEIIIGNFFRNLCIFFNYI